MFMAILVKKVAVVTNENLKMESNLIKHKAKIYNYINSIVKDRSLADDLLQEVFIKVFEKGDKYNEEGYLTTWIMAIAKNACIDHFRRLKRKPKICEVDVEILNIEVDEVEEVVVSIPLKFEALLDNLNEVQKETIILKFYKGLTYKKIAELQNKSINTVQGQCKYGLRNLRKKIVAQV